MELPLVSETENPFIFGFLSIAATIFALAVCFGLVAIVIIYIVEWCRTMVCRFHSTIYILIRKPLHTSPGLPAIWKHPLILPVKGMEQ